MVVLSLLRWRSMDLGHGNCDFGYDLVQFVVICDLGYSCAVICVPVVF